MKKYIILLLILFISIHTVLAQWTSFEQEFEKHPNTLRFRIEMEGDTVSYIAVDFKKDSLMTPTTIKSEHYDFRFGGDHYLFVQKYNGDILKLTPQVVDSSKIVNEPRGDQILRTIVNQDSIYHQYAYPMNWWIHAGYGEGRDMFKVLGKELQHYAVEIAGEKDSIIFFQAIIGLDGNIETMELTQGKRGRYTDEIICFFKNQEGVWHPAMKDGRLFRGLVDICVRLSDKGMVQTSHSSSLRTPKIEIKDYTNMYYWYQLPER